MKNVTFAILLFLTLTYLIFSFGTWEINPKFWSENTRFGFSLLCFLLLIVYIFAYAYEKDNKDKND